ncbi:hypothetical protein C8Q80DRAFT_1267314 [Daedaleopsis nitida]|nr:hypothetical protein C8Q80DRAFT_1267314 [Daedaleopsis nitida]
MLFKSPLDPDMKSTQQLVILCHAQERVLLPLPKTYEDAQEAARTEFSVSGELVFETDDLLGSDQPHVRIHPAAWEGISTVLRCVHVKLSQSHGQVVGSRPRPSEALAAGSGSRRVSSQKRISMVGATPFRLSNAMPQAVERQSLSARKAPIGGTPSSRPSSVYAPVIVEAGPSSLKRSPPPALAVDTLSTSKIEELGDDDEEEEHRIRSPTKKGARQRIMSDYGLEPEDDDSQGTDVTHNIEDNDEEFDQLDDSEIVSAGLSKLQIKGKVPPASSSRSGSGSLVELDSQPSESNSRKAERSASVRQLDEPEPKIKAEKSSARADTKASQATQQSSRTQGKADESFLIQIEYNDDPESRSLFKTRGRHMVSKVLMQACRTFGLEEYYRNARLILIVEEENDDGDIVFQRRYACERNDTMADAGAEPNARFVVELFEDGDEEDQ